MMKSLTIEERKALLHAMGVNWEDMEKPLIGIINSWNELNPGHFHFKQIINKLKSAVEEVGGFAVELPVLGVCDGFCSNTSGDRYTLPTRELVAGEVQTLADLNLLDGMILLASCDKIVPGMILWAMLARYTNRNAYRRVYAAWTSRWEAGNIRFDQENFCQI